MNILLKMLNLLTSAYRKTDVYNAENGLPLETNIGRLFAVFGWGLGLIEGNAERVRLWANLDNAKATVLDRYGANFGVARGGANDVFYRLMIKVKVLSQLSGGDLETVISAIAALYEIDAADLQLFEVFPAKLKIYIHPWKLTDEKKALTLQINALIKRIVAAGVGFDIHLTHNWGEVYLQNASWADVLGMRRWGDLLTPLTWQDVFDQYPAWSDMQGKTWGEVCAVRSWQEAFNMYPSWGKVYGDRSWQDVFDQNWSDKE